MLPWGTSVLMLALHRETTGVPDVFTNLVTSRVLAKETAAAAVAGEITVLLFALLNHRTALTENGNTECHLTNALSTTKSSTSLSYVLSTGLITGR